MTIQSLPLTERPAWVALQAHHKRVAVVDREKLVEIDLARLRQARMADDVVQCKPQRLADEPFEFGLLHSHVPVCARPPGRPARDLRKLVRPRNATLS